MTKVDKQIQVADNASLPGNPDGFSACGQNRLFLKHEIAYKQLHLSKEKEFGREKTGDTKIQDTN